MSLLEVKDIVLQFGGLKVIDSMNMTIEEGSIMSLIGPNGAGKTSIFNSITGFYQPNSGAINFRGKSIMRKKPHTITQAGMARTFQNLRLFKNMSVIDNVKAGMHCRSHV
ncbi:MAG: ATP-binding cassette domain-containing protein, partial [Desulfuromonadales bacterium]|nr:ATP-binding cassette domain-containing protein [Desulfuromonadales bacterium]